MMSVRGSSPKMASDNVSEPASPPSSVVTFISMSRTLLGFGGSRVTLGRRGSSRRPRRRLGELELAGHWNAIGQLLLHRVAHQDPAALDARHRAFDQDQAALDVGLHHFEIERGDAVDAEVAGHFFVLEGLAGILAATGRAVRAVRDRDAVARPQAGEIPAFHRSGPALAG